MKSLNLPAILFCFCNLLNLNAYGQASTVEIRGSDLAWELLVNGKPFYVRGVVGYNFPEKILEYGGNSVRMGSRRTDLDKVQQLGLMALVNLPAGAERDGMNYDDTAAVRKQTDRIVTIVTNTKDHPAVLFWAIGNELDYIPPLKPFNPKVWDAINSAAAAIKKIDSKHPVMTVIGTSMMHKVADIVKRCPDLDLLGVNSYGDIYTLGDTLRKYGWNKPYVIAEWGPDGYWEVKKTPWKAPWEQTGREKYDCYRDKYIKGIAGREGQCLGSYVFYWSGNKQETTHTWFCMFDEKGLETPLVGLMHEMWTGNKKKNLAPVAETMSIDGKGWFEAIVLKAGTSHSAECRAADSDGDKLVYRWEIRPEAVYASYAGQGEKMPQPIPGLVTGEGPSITFKAPDTPGAYRLFAYVYDSNGHFSSVNVPFYSYDLNNKPAFASGQNK